MSIYTVDEIARKLRVSETTVYKEIHERRLRAIKIGRQWRIRKMDLDSYLESQATGGHDNAESETGWDRIPEEGLGAVVCLNPYAGMVVQGKEASPHPISAYSESRTCAPAGDARLQGRPVPGL